MDKNIKNKSFRKALEKAIAITAVVVVAFTFIFLIWTLFGQRLKELFLLLQHGNEQEIGDYLNAAGEKSGLLSVFFMSVLQVVSIFIPGMAIEVVAGVIYGWLKAFIMTFSGFVFGNVLVFFVARKLGRRINDILDLRSHNSWITEKINRFSPPFVLAMAYLVPGVPNGIVPYIAARVDIRGKTFAKAVAASSWMQILCNCIAGHYLIRRNIPAVLLVFGIQITTIAVAVTNRNWFLSLGGERKQSESDHAVTE